MADLATVEAAFLKADAAGDIPAAMALAGEVRRLRALQQQPPAPLGETPGAGGVNIRGERVEPSLAEDAFKGVADFATGASSLMRGGANLIKSGAGDAIWPKSTDTGALKFAGELADPVAWTIAGGAGHLSKIPAVGRIFAPGGYAKVTGSGALEGAKALGRNLATGAAIGAPIGALSEGGDAVTGAAVGAAANVVLPPTLAVAAKGLGKVWDVLVGRLGPVNAAKILREAAGADLPAIKAAAAAAPADLTTTQATAGIKRDTFDALGGLAKRNDRASFFSRLGQAQEDARIAALEAVKPDLKTAIADRTTVSKPLYEAARKAGNIVNTQSVADKVDDLLAKNPGNAELVRELNKIKTGLYDGDVLRADAQQVASVIDGLKASMANKENKFILGELKDIKDGLISAVPGFKKAEQAYAGMSPKVNQAQVLQEMIDVLKKPGGGERVGPFLNVLGKGEQALLKKSTGFPRYESGDLSKVLTGKGQMDAVNKVVAELEREISLKKGVAAGEGGLAGILSENTSRFKLPNWINAKIAVTNRALDELEMRVNKKTMNTVYEAMKSGKTAAELLDVLPTTERNKVLATLIANREAPYVAAGAAQMSNAGSPPQRDRPKALESIRGDAPAAKPKQAPRTISSSFVRG